MTAYQEKLSAALTNAAQGISHERGETVFIKMLSPSDFQVSIVEKHILPLVINDDVYEYNSTCDTIYACRMPNKHETQKFLAHVDMLKKASAKYIAKSDDPNWLSHYVADADLGIFSCQTDAYLGSKEPTKDVIDGFFAEMRETRRHYNTKVKSQLEASKYDMDNIVDDFMSYMTTAFVIDDAADLENTLRLSLREVMKQLDESYCVNVYLPSRRLFDEILGLGSRYEMFSDLNEILVRHSGLLGHQEWKDATCIIRRALSKALPEPELTNNMRQSEDDRYFGFIHFVPNDVSNNLNVRLSVRNLEYDIKDARDKPFKIHNSLAEAFTAYLFQILEAKHVSALKNALYESTKIPDSESGITSWPEHLESLIKKTKPSLEPKAPSLKPTL